MKPFRINPSLSSLLVLLSYSAFTLMAFSHYPLAYSPARNWLSDLGNKVVNPIGAIYYNAGIVITSAWLMLFFLGFSVVKSEENRIQNLMVLLTQLFGVSGCVSMALSAFFTIDNPEPHSALSAVLYISLGTGFAFSVAALRYNPKWPRMLLVLGVLSASFDLVASVFFSSVPVFEWITILLFLTYVVTSGNSMKKTRIHTQTTCY